MKVLAQVLVSKQVEYDGKSFNKIEGYINNLGVFKLTVPEKLIPDKLDGKEVVMGFDLYIDKNCKPQISLKSISCNEIEIEDVKKEINGNIPF